LTRPIDLLPGRVCSIAMSMFVCLSVRACITRKHHGQTSPILCTLGPWSVLWLRCDAIIM